MMKEIADRTTNMLDLRSPDQRLAKSLNHLSQAEADIAWQMVQAFNASDDPSVKARLFKAALEELDHAASLSKMARRYSDFPLPLAAPRRRYTCNTSGELTDFEAWAFTDEAGAQDNIPAFESLPPRAGVREMSLRIGGGENERQALAYGDVEKIVRSKSRAGDTYHRHRLKQVYDAWLEFGHAMGNFMFAFWLSVIYYLSGPLFGWLCKRRIKKLDRWQRPES